MTTKKNSSRLRKSKRVDSPQKLVPTEDISGTKAAFASENYNKVARTAKLEALVLTASTFKVVPDFFSVRQPDDSAIKYTYGCKSSNDLYNARDGVASCHWTWTVDGIFEGKKLISVTATYAIYYGNLAECEEEAVKRFMRRVGRFATYPYFRSHVSHASWESSAQLPLLPTIAS